MREPHDTYAPSTTPDTTAGVGWEHWTGDRCTRHATVRYCGAVLCPHCGGELKPATKLPEYLTFTVRNGR